MAEHRPDRHPSRAPRIEDADYPEVWYALAGLVLAGCGLLGVRSTRYISGHPVRQAVGGCLVAGIALCSWILGVHTLFAVSDRLAERRRL